MHLTLLQFTRDAEKLVQLDLSNLSPSPPPETVATTALCSQRSPGIAIASTTSLLRAPSQTWSSPASLKRKSFSAATIVSTQYDPFTEDGNSEDDRRRKKTKFGRASGQWRFLERSPSPEKQNEYQIGEEVDKPEQMHCSADREEPIPAQLTPKSLGENLPSSKTMLKSSAAQSEVVTQFVTPQPVIGDEDHEKANLPEQPRLRPQASLELSLVSPLQAFKNRSPLPQDQVDWEEQIAETSNDGVFDRESPDLHGIGQIHELQDSVQGIIEIPKSNTLLESSAGFLDERTGWENLAHEHSQIYHDASVQHEDGLGYQEYYGATVPVDQKPSPTLMSSAAEEASQRDQKNEISSNLQLLKNVQQEDLWNGSQIDRNKVFNLDISNTGRDFQHYELHDIAENPDNKNDKIAEAGDKLNFIHHGQDILPGKLVAEAQPGFIADESDDDASDLDDEKQDLQTDGEHEMGYSGQRGDASSVEQFPTTTYLGNTLSFDNATQRHDQNRMEVISICSDESEESEESQDTDDGESEELDSPSKFDRPLNAGDQVERVPSPGETFEEQRPVSSLVEPVAQSINTLNQLDAGNDADHSTVDDIPSDLKNKHLLPFTPEASGVSSVTFEQGESNDDRALRPTGTRIMSKQELFLNQADRTLFYDSRDAETDSHLITPLATQIQQVDDGSRCEGEVEALDDHHNLPTPRDTQTISEDRLDAMALNQPRSLIGLLRELRSSSGAKLEEINDLHETKDIDVWFNGDKHDENASSDERQYVQDEESHREPASHEVHPNSKSFDSNPPKIISAELHYKNKPEDLLPSPLSTGFRTPLSYFVSLSRLSEYFNSTIDVMVIAVSASQFGRATKGPRDYHETVYITDPSSATSDSLPHITTAQIFRPFKVALPVVSTGDTVLLRNFKVQTQKQKLMLLSTDSSAWAVFRKEHDVQIRGPQLDFGPEERGFARGLADWWTSLDDQGRAELLNSVPKPEAGGKSKGKEKERPSRKSTVVHELRDGTRYMDGRVDGMDSVHELRDGTVYTDDAV